MFMVLDNYCFCVLIVFFDNRQGDSKGSARGGDIANAKRDGQSSQNGQVHMSPNLFRFQLDLVQSDISEFFFYHLAVLAACSPRLLPTRSLWKLSSNLSSPSLSYAQRICLSYTLNNTNHIISQVTSKLKIDYIIFDPYVMCCDWG